MRLAIVAPDLSRAVRAAVATVVPFYLGLAYDEPALSWVALGGWLASLADPGGSRRLRLVSMAWFTSLGALAVAIASATAEVPALAAVAVAGIAFVAALARSLGGNASTIGNIIAIAAAIAATARNDHPAMTGALFAIGALWAVLASSVAWPIWPHLPVRRAIAKTYRELAAYARALAGPHASEEAWSAVARRHQRAVRAAIEEARVVMVQSRAQRAGETPVGANLRTLLGAADLQLFSLIDLGERVETGEPAPLADLILLFDAIDTCVMTRVPGPALPPTSPRVAFARAAWEVARDLDAEPTASGAPIAHRPPAWTYRDALSPRSPYFRHGIRVAVTVAISIDVARLVSPTHASWITVTAMAVLQPYLGPTLQRLVERVIGTLIGGAIAAGLMAVLHAPLALAAAMLPLAMAAVLTRPRSYRLFVVFLTPVFLLVADHWHPESGLALVRIVDVAIGGAIAFVTALVIPSTERRRLPEALAAVFDALSRYVEKVGAPGADLASARREVGIALENAELSLERMLAEPKLLQLGAERAVLLITYARRLSNSLTSHSIADHAPLAPPVKAYVLTSLAAARDHAPALPMAPPDESRLVHYAELIRAQARLV